MPTPATAKWPKPKSEDEFEDIVVDFVRLRWKDPNAQRHGRRGQRQHGVDVVGHPPWSKGRTVGAQCKNADDVTLAVVVAEVEKAKSFPGGLAEFFVVTSGDRDAALQSEVREHFKAKPAPFHVEVVFWPDVVADISVDDALVAKHWKGFAPTNAALAERRVTLANETTRAVNEIRMVLPGVVHAWGKWRSSRTEANTLALVREIESFQVAHQALIRCRDEVRALLGQYIAAPIQSVGDMCSGVLASVAANLQERVPDFISDRDYEDVRDRGRGKNEILDLLQLMENWAAPYLGREGAHTLNEDEIEARYWRISGFPDDQVREMVEASRVVRQAERSGSTREEIERVIAERALVTFSIDVLGSRDVAAQAIVDELDRTIVGLATRGETGLQVRLHEPFDEALAAALEANPGAIAVLGQQVAAIAKRHPSIKSITVSAGGLPGMGWSFGTK
ncbi:MAG: hypothetical protein KF773_24770 [Deltaproteobacteria bacterium]|nr:hypothetical protein [Deltaproteobacteria bacterium]